MVRYTTILKVIEEELVKCKATENALKVGATGIWETLRDENGEVIGSTLTYSDGTKITYNEYDEVSSIDYNGETINYIGWEQSTDFFDSQRDELIERYGEEAYRKFCEFAYLYQSEFYEEINEGMRTDGVDSVRNLISSEIVADDLDVFLELLENNDLSNYPSFLTLRGIEHLFDDSGLEKRIIYDKSFNSQTVGMGSREVMDYFGGEMDGINKGWLIITPFSKDNRARSGAYLDNAITEHHYRLYGDTTIRGEDEFLVPPKQKFMRTVIDEKNRIIIQEPYAPK